MNKYILSLILFVFLQNAYSQNTSGVIKFERKTYWINIMSRLPWITQEDIDRDKLTWGKNQGRPSPYELHFAGDKSIYMAGEEDNDAGYSWSSEEYLIIRDYKSNESSDLIETLGKKYLVEDLPTYKWKILNEIKEIDGYLCMKAETKDTIKNQKIFAWFTDMIPVQGGPEGFYGLPGMILEIDINNGDVLITASEVTISEKELELPIPKKLKGKKIKRADLNQKIKSFISDSFKSKRNPYWTIRY